MTLTLTTAEALLLQQALREYAEDMKAYAATAEQLDLTESLRYFKTLQGRATKLRAKLTPLTEEGR